jgi:MATE family, multidrug efflux pump
VMSLAALAFLLAPGQILGILTDRPDVIAATRPLLLVAAFFQISDGVQGTGAGVLRGAGDTRFAFVANVVGHYAVGLPVALLLGFHAHLGIVGIWWGLCGGLTAVAATLLIRFTLASRRAIAPIEAHPSIAAEEMPLAPLAAPPLPFAPGE